MEIEFDPIKSERNARDRGLPFTAALDFDWETAIVVESPRSGEPRKLAIGWLYDRLHSIAYVHRGERTRIISLRRAHEIE
jgi:uncharacterized DUF497 family protein